MTRIFRIAAQICAVGLCSCLLAAAAPEPQAPGKLVDLDGQRLHVNCTGKGYPTVVIESGLGDLSGTKESRGQSTEAQAGVHDSD
jgi:hypothetical protein